MMILLAVPLVVWDFAESPGGFVGSGDADQWEWGVPQGPPGGTEAVWATILDNLYLNDSEDVLEMPGVDLDGAERPTLRFRHWYRIVEGDAATVEVDPGSGWTRVEPVYGYPEPEGYVGASGWTEASVDLSAFGPSPRIRFKLATDASFADRGWYLSQVGVYDGDVTPPRFLEVEEPTHTQDLDGPYRIRAWVEDDVGVERVTLHWVVDGIEASAELQLQPDGAFEGLVPGQPPDTQVRWSLEAVDAAGNVAAWPAVGEREFRVYLAGPTDLTVVGPERQVGDVVTLDWQPPATPHPILGYHLVDVGGQRAPELVVEPPVALHLTADDPLLWHVAALYTEGLGDFSDPVVVDLEIPTVVEVEPDQVAPGETRYLRLRGASLYLHPDTADLDLGPGITVEELQIRDASSLDAVIAVDGDAPPGARTVTVTGSYGPATLSEGLWVVDGLDVPRILTVSPRSVVQGATEQLRVTANVPFAGPVAVEHPAGVVLQGEPMVDGAVAWVDLGVHSDAAPGVYSLVLDDSTHRLVADVEVTRRVYTGQRRCAVGGGGPSGWGLVLLPLWALARRRGR